MLNRRFTMVIFVTAHVAIDMLYEHYGLATKSLSQIVSEMRGDRKSKTYTLYFSRILKIKCSYIISNILLMPIYSHNLLNRKKKLTEKNRLLFFHLFCLCTS